MTITQYAIRIGDDIEVDGFGAMYNVIQYIRKNLMNEQPRDITVIKTTNQKFVVDHDMHMVDFLAWLDEAADRC